MFLSGHETSAGNVVMLSCEEVGLFSYLSGNHIGAYAMTSSAYLGFEPAHLGVHRSGCPPINVYKGLRSSFRVPLFGAAGDLRPAVRLLHVAGLVRLLRRSLACYRGDEAVGRSGVGRLGVP